MAEPASLLAEQGFAVYVLHYFDRTGTTEIDGLQTIFRHFPVWMKTLWDAVSFVARSRKSIPNASDCWDFLWVRTSRYRPLLSTRASRPSSSSSAECPKR